MPTVHRRRRRPASRPTAAATTARPVDVTPLWIVAFIDLPGDTHEAGADFWSGGDRLPARAAARGAGPVRDAGPTRRAPTTCASSGSRSTRRACTSTSTSTTRATAATEAEALGAERAGVAVRRPEDHEVARRLRLLLRPRGRWRAPAADHLARRPHVVRRPGLPRHPAQPLRRRAGVLGGRHRLAAARPAAGLGVRPAHAGPGAAAPAAAPAARRRAGQPSPPTSTGPPPTTRPSWPRTSPPEPRCRAASRDGPCSATPPA